MLKKIYNQKNAFSLLEIIFAIAIMAIIAVVAIPKFNNTLTNTNKIKIKSDILLIREGLQNHKNKMILSNNNNSLNSLDNGTLLFNKILQHPILTSSEQKATSWSKQSNQKYLVWIDSTNKLEFTYDKSNYTFDCDIKNNYCKELTQ